MLNNITESHIYNANFQALSNSELTSIDGGVLGQVFTAIAAFVTIVGAVQAYDYIVNEVRDGLSRSSCTPCPDADRP